jgi:hypothetical protein
MRRLARFLRRIFRPRVEPTPGQVMLALHIADAGGRRAMIKGVKP